MNLTGKVTRSLVAAGLAVSLTTGFTFAAIGTGTVTAGTLRLREKASTNSSILAYAPKGAKITIMEDVGSGWYKVMYKDIKGYMDRGWLDISKDGGADALPEQGQDSVATPEQAQDSTATAPKQIQGTVNAGPLNVRSGAGTGYDRVGSLNKGTSVTILDDSITGWYKISSGSVAGYVSAQYISLGEAQSSASETGMVITGVLNVRSGPGTSYIRVGTLTAGDTVTILDSSINGWYQISKGTLTGYVSSQYIAIPGEHSTSNSVGTSAAAIAASLVGCRYVSGAAGPSSFDCSGLTYYIYRQLGYSIARGSSSQYRQSGYFVSTDSMQPGDLVYFFDPKFDGSGGTLPTTHVGIYMGNNQFIHASTTSYSVQYDQLFGGYYGKYVVGVKRIG